MNLHGDLLALARDLAARAAGGPPAQAALRRAVSTAYYALFHMLANEATERMFGAGSDRAGLRACLARGFAHRTMKNTARAFMSGAAPPKLAPGMDGLAPQPELVRVAKALLTLQHFREVADYDVAHAFAHDHVFALVERTEAAFEDWAAVRGSVQADVFLAGLFAFGGLRI